MAKSTTRIVALCSARRSSSIPLDRGLWQGSGTPPRDELGSMGPDWFALYSEGVATVTAKGPASWPRTR